MLGMHATLLSPLYEEVGNIDINTENAAKDGNDSGKNSGNDSGNAGDIDDSKAARRLVKSMSFSVQNYNNKSEGMSFGDMSEYEWKVFLESFEKLLPQLFDGTDHMSAKQRLGTSWEF